MMALNANTAIGVCLLGVALIHLTPAVGVLGAAKLQALYGVQLGDANVLLLMRHRAVLFGLMGLVMAASVWWPQWRPLALGLGWISVLSFLGLAQPLQALNVELLRVVRVDWVAAALLLVATALQFTMSQPAQT